MDKSVLVKLLFLLGKLIDRLLVPMIIISVILIRFKVIALHIAFKLFLSLFFLTVD